MKNISTEELITDTRIYSLEEGIQLVEELQEENKQSRVGLPKVAKRRYDLSSAGKPEGIWRKYSKLQVFRAIRSLRGTASVSVYLYLLDRASGMSKRSWSCRDLTYRVKVETIARNTGLSERTVLRSLAELEEQRFILRKASQTLDTVHFLDPDSPGKVLQTSPGNWDLLSAQGLNSYITFPKDSLPKIYTLNVTETATYVTVMDLVTVNQDEVFWIGRKNLRQETGLGREGFKSGLKGCHKKRLFKYAKYGAMEVFDPKTGKPTKRWRKPSGFAYRDYEAKDGDFDLNFSITPEQRAELVAEHVGISVANPTEGVWFNKLTCPFADCAGDAFSISFTLDCYRCHGCGYRDKRQARINERYGSSQTAERKELGQGKLCQLVARVKNIPIAEAIELFRQRASVEVEVQI